ncbi:interferon-induced, double-stranded RNA-activated protein kinase [Microcaecilia unicolor]|uniref:non-specific serine/threonine protein kinase n=1 Tax=Microcaecilia unicolor TaxID=1415580 RepID=A0A6P7XNN8_9AMPH|nr:interferon-induced, double-stranded RNA-activated protein kinase [Microcaecilia unicolor]
MSEHAASPIRAASPSQRTSPTIRESQQSLLNPSRHITSLNEYVQRTKKKLDLVYTEQAGPAHLQIFTCRYKIDGREYREGTGKSKVEAKREAARLTLEELENNDQLNLEGVLRTDAASTDPDVSYTGEINFKGKLNEYCQQRRRSLKFEELERRGPPHDQQFVSQAVVDGKKFKEAEGKTKREAERKAAQNALTELESTSVHVNSEELGASASVSAMPYDTNQIYSASAAAVFSGAQNLFPNGSLEELESNNSHSTFEGSQMVENDESKQSNSLFDEKRNYIGKLNEFCQKTKQLLKFAECDRHGLPHNPEFVIQAVVGNRKFKEGEGKNKKMAEQKAAYYALAELEQPPVASPVTRRSQFETCHQTPNNISESTLSNSHSATKSTAVEDRFKNMKLDDTSYSEEPPSDTSHKNDKGKNKIRKEKVLAPNFKVKLNENKQVCSVDESFNKDFEDISQLGKGGFGHVFKAKKKIDQVYYAVKKVKIHDEKALREILMAKLKHDNIVQYFHAWRGIDTYVDTDESTSSSNARDNSGQVYECLFIQIELCEKGTLKDWISKRDKINENISFSVFEQMLQGVKYIHSKNLIHRDLKPSNIFLSEESKIKIGDFGLVTSMTDEDNKSLERTMGTGTLGYMAPEQKILNQYESEVDIYALGLILHELLWIYKTDAEKYAYWDGIRNGAFPAEFVKQYHTQIWWMKKMLLQNPKERPSAANILTYLTNINAAKFQKTV